MAPSYLGSSVSAQSSPVRQYRLRHLVRGPLYAFAVPQGDLDALSDVARICSEFWNGANSIVFGVRRDGRIPGWLDDLRRLSDLDACYLHEGLGERARRGALGRFPGASPIYEGLVDDEVHPLHVAPEPASGKDRVRVAIPRYDSGELRRLALIAWGELPAGERKYWHERVDLFERAGATAHGALLAGQVASGNTSPLRLSADRAPAISWQAAAHHPVLFVLNPRSFDDLVWFWNTRARRGDIIGRAAVAAIPLQSLAQPDQLACLHNWCALPGWAQATPDLIVWARPRDQAAARAALEAQGLSHRDTGRLSFRFGGHTEVRERPLFTFAMPPIGGAIERGLIGESLITLDDRRARLALTAPPDLPLGLGRQVRLELRGLPTGFPLSRVVAEGIIPNGYVVSGSLAIITDAQRTWNMDVKLPERWELLESWARERGYEVELSQDGRYGTALLERLAGHAGLDKLASEVSVSVLEALTPQSRLKLAQRLVSEAREKHGAQLDEGLLAEELKRGDVSLDQPARTLGDLKNVTGQARNRIVEALHGLIGHGLVQSGIERRCPSCNFRQFWALGELDDVVGCRACRARFVLALREHERDEASLRYRLDGLMARAMDQDLLAVLLALRKLKPEIEDRPWSAWPGLLFRRGAEEIDVDLLVSDGTDVDICECKTRAGGLGVRQLERITDLAADLGARVHLASLEGSFRETRPEIDVTTHGRRDLLA
jgi:hypothetical protein